MVKHHSLADIPPSTAITDPVIHFESSEAKNKIALETSSGSPILFKGNDPSNILLAFSSCKYGSIIGLRIVEGAIQLHLILYCPYSTAMLFVSIMMPAFVTPYTENGTLGIALIPNNDDIFTMLPDFCSIIIGTTAFMG